LSLFVSHLALQVQHGFVKQNIDIKKYIDFSLVEEAAKRLK
jgi:hypothetical protein